MDELGLIREQLDIKILILYVLARLPAPIDRDTLAQVVFCDGGVDYFSFSDCLADLVSTGHIAEQDGRYTITELGKADGAVMETGLPLSVQTRALEALGPAAERAEREAMIQVSHSSDAQGCVVELALSDGETPLLRLSAQVGEERKARQIEKNFSARAEELYFQMIELLTKE